LGWLEEVGSLLEAADVAAMSSDYEGAPVFALECMARMAPLVSTDVGNISELLGEGEGVITVPPRDPAAMARALAALLCDPARRATQVRAAGERLRSYEIDNAVSEFTQLYDRLFGAASKRRTRTLNRTDLRPVIGRIGAVDVVGMKAGVSSASRGRPIRQRFAGISKRSWSGAGSWFSRRSFARLPRRYTR
jgi:Glycosyl transferases group 1